MKKIVELLLGERERYILEQRIFNGFTLVGMFVSFFSIIACYLLTLHILAILLSTISFIVMIFFYLFSRLFGEYKLFSYFLLIFVIFILLPGGWFTNGGSLGGAQYHFIFSGILIAAFSRGRESVFFIFFQIIIVIMIVWGEYFYPRCVIGYLDETTRVINVFFGIALTTVALGLLVTLYSRSYEFERKRAFSCRIKLKQMVLIDQDTKILADHYLLNRLEEEILRASVFQRPLMAMLFHYMVPENNEYLKQHYPMGGIDKLFALFLTDQLRDTDLIGEEVTQYFLIIFPETELDQCTFFMKRLRDHIQIQFDNLIHQGVMIYSSSLQWRGESLAQFLVQLHKQIKSDPVLLSEQSEKRER